VDVSLNEVTSTTPLRVSAIGKPTGDAWGSTYIDKGFRSNLQTLLGPLARHISPGTMLEILREWEKGKIQVPLEDIRIPIKGLLKDISEGRGEEFTVAHLQELAVAFAEGAGMSDSPPLKARGESLWVFAPYIASLIQVNVGLICDHVRGLLDPASSSYCGRSLDGLYLVGGFAASNLLLEVRAGLQRRHRVLSDSLPPPTPPRHLVRHACATAAACAGAEQHQQGDAQVHRGDATQQAGQRGEPRRRPVRPQFQHHRLAVRGHGSERCRLAPRRRGGGGGTLSLHGVSARRVCAASRRSPTRWRRWSCLTSACTTSASPSACVTTR
jgi:hypothetical protein